MFLLLFTPRRLDCLTAGHVPADKADHITVHKKSNEILET